jgi:hypothetical protein
LTSINAIKACWSSLPDLGTIRGYVPALRNVCDVREIDSVEDTSDAAEETEGRDVCEPAAACDTEVRDACELDSEETEENFSVKIFMKFSFRLACEDESMVALD